MLRVVHMQEDTPARYLLKFYTEEMALENAFAPQNHNIYADHIYDKFIFNKSQNLPLKMTPRPPRALAQSLCKES